MWGHCQVFVQQIVNWFIILYQFVQLRYRVIVDGLSLNRSWNVNVLSSVEQLVLCGCVFNCLLIRCQFVFEMFVDWSPSDVSLYIKTLSCICQFIINWLLIVWYLLSGVCQLIFNCLLFDCIFVVNWLPRVFQLRLIRFHMFIMYSLIDC